MLRYTKRESELKIFVREGTSIEKQKEKKFSVKFDSLSPLTGNEAKEFYENVINEPFGEKYKKCSNTIQENDKNKLFKSESKAATKNKPSKDIDLLRMAQNNDSLGLKKFFSQAKNYNIDVIDDFGWTPLMCAACSGAEAAVQILLDYKADPTKCDKLGNTALKLAMKRNHAHIGNLITKHINKVQIVNTEVDNVVDSIETFFCIPCNKNFETNKKKHESSTLHLFNCKIKTPTFYGIPESNKGFQLLLKEGWNKETGLGPKGSGRKFPVKAIMKKDRRGIGAPNNGYSNKTLKNSEKKFENKTLHNYRRWRDKNFERNFRLQFLC